MRGKTWTKKDENYLYYDWGESTVKNLAQKLNRTPLAIILKAKRLNLGSPYWRTKFTAHKLSHLLGVDQHTITDYWISKYGLKAKKRIMKFKKRMYLIDYDNLMEWLEKNQDKWDSRRFKKFALILEPDWLKEKRILDSYEPKRKNQKWNRLEDTRLLNLFYGERKTIKEISEIMERSYNGIEKRLSRVRPYIANRRLANTYYQAELIK